MGLIEKWRAMARHGFESNEWTNTMVQTLDNACDELTDASTPRPPKAEWFEKWDGWMIRCYGRWEPVQNVRFSAENAGLPARLILPGGKGVRLFEIDECIPVRREGPPAMDVGWGVVGG